jgi:hypothetical protein
MPSLSVLGRDRQRVAPHDLTGERRFSGKEIAMRPDNITISADTIRKPLLLIWLEQACRRPADRPETQDRLLAKWMPLVNEAVAELARLFSADVLPADPVHAVWRAFPRLDREHCTNLAALLIEARADARDSA